MKFIHEKTNFYLVNLSNFIIKKSLDQAAKEQDLKELSYELEKIVPDIRHHYSTFKLNDILSIKKVRYLHAFQISLVKRILDDFKKSVVIVDIGDSSGDHLEYIRRLYSHNKNIKSLSINIDENAILKIRKRGFPAKKAMAEDVKSYDIGADIFLCFQTLEHLINPCGFLYALSSKTNAKYLIITVPYVRKSRIGLYHIRSGYKKNPYTETTHIFDKEHADAETTHIFELSPEDWKLLVKHCGWRIVTEKICLQYPKTGILGLAKQLLKKAWEKKDFEGIYGMILTRDKHWSKLYTNWQ